MKALVSVRRSQRQECRQGGPAIRRAAVAVRASCIAAALGACAAAPALDLPDAAPAVVEAPQPAGPPGTDIFLFDLSEGGEGPRLGARVNITDRDGYDNQPSFTPDGEAVLFTSIREGAQADIFRYHIGQRTTTQVTATPESEYSPTPLPDGRGISVVRVEMDSTQRLWRFDHGGRDPRLVLEEVRPVGYHAWIDVHTLALFVLGSPPTLQIADTRTGRAERVASDIGRSLHRVPGRNAVSFVEKAQDGEWQIRALDLATRGITPIAPTLRDAEDHAWTPTGTLLMGQGSVLFRWNAEAEEWWEVADLDAAGVREITRLAVSPRGDRIAVVGRR